MPTREITHLAAYGRALYDLGYAVVPIRRGLKHPGYAGWEATEASPDTIERWSKDRSFEGVGVLAEHTPGVDIDVRDEAVSRELADWCQVHIGFAPVRVGHAPKRLLVYKADGTFPKQSSRVFVDAIGDTHKLEVLGAGQQWVAYATHPGTGQPYEWVGGEQLTDIGADQLWPITLHDAKAAIAEFERIAKREGWQPVPSSRTSIGNALSDSGDAMSRAKETFGRSLEQIEADLAALDPDMDMATWVKIGTGVHHETGGSDAGRRLFDAWSQGSYKYKAGEVVKAWRRWSTTGNGNGTATYASVYAMAQSARRVAGRFEGLDDLVEAADHNVPPDDLDGFLERYVYVEKDDAVLDLARHGAGALYPIATFRNATAHARHEVPAPTQADPDQTKIAPIHAAWLVHHDRQTVQRIVYAPGQKRLFRRSDGADVANGFYWPKLTGDADAADLALWDEFVGHLFPIANEREWVLNWCAFLLQKPHERLHVHPLHIAARQGTGRTTFMNVLTALVGMHNTKSTSIEKLSADNDFHEFLDDCRLLKIDEAETPAGQPRQMSAAMKERLTAGDLMINRKFIAAEIKKIYPLVFMASNRWDAIGLRETDRRVQVITGPDAPKPDAFYRQLNAWLGPSDGWDRSDALAAIDAALRGRDIGSWHPQRADVTAGLARIAGATSTPTEAAFRQFVADPPFVALGFSQLVAYLQTGMDDPDALNEKELLKLLQLHCVYCTRRMRVGGRDAPLVRPWIFDPKNASDDDLIRGAVRDFGDPEYSFF